MGKILLDKHRREVIESMFEYDIEKGKIYSIRFKGLDRTFWCANLSNVYITIERFMRGELKE